MSNMTRKEWLVAAGIILAASIAYAPCLDWIAATEIEMGKGVVIDTPSGSSARTGMLIVQYGHETFSVNSAHHGGLVEKGSLVDVVQIRGSLMNYGYGLR